MNRINEHHTSSDKLKFVVLVLHGTMFSRDQGICDRRVSKKKHQVKTYQDFVRAKLSKARVVLCRLKASVLRANLTAVYVFDATSAFRKQHDSEDSLFEEGTFQARVTF